MLTAACVLAFGIAGAQAQIVTPDSADPFAPKAAIPRKPQTFQKFGPQQQAQLSQTPTFTEPPSAAGDTGFDSTNSKNAKAKARALAAKKPGATARAQATPAGEPPPLAISPYQVPFPGTGNAAKSAMASANGAPPVEIGPIRKPLKKRKRADDDDPYAQLGVQAGAFTLYPAVELIGGYDSNPGQSATAKGASLYSVQPELRAQSNWSRHELKADLRGSYTGYSPDSDPTLSRPNVNGKIDGRVDVTRDTRLDLGGRLLVATDNPGSPNLQAGLSKLPIYTTLGGSAGVGHKFNRVDLSIKGDAERTAYQDSKLTDGTTLSNEDRNYDQYGVKLRGGYELLPGVTPYVEGGVDTRKHDLATDSSGYQRDSKGWTALVGSTFEMTRVLTGETGIGYTQRTYDDPRLDKLGGVVGNASLIWTANALTTVKFTAASGIQESTVAGVSGVFSRDYNIQVDHAFRRWLIGTVKAGYGTDTYKGTDTAGTTTTTTAICGCVVSTPGGTTADRVDNRYTVGLGLTYKLSRWAQIKGEFRQDWLRSNVSSNNFTESTFLVGLRLQQ
ncbi:MAG: outer membrane beta-barrel protein [Proteobacteria bacterium]|nr:outer membrane beta-barrel protein [Pseudomonadota bacterium]